MAQSHTILSPVTTSKTTVSYNITQQEGADAKMYGWLSAFLCLSGGVGVVGNGLVVVSVIKLQQLRRMTYILIANLCAAGMLNCVFTIPVHASRMLIRKASIDDGNKIEDPSSYSLLSQNDPEGNVTFCVAQAHINIALFLCMFTNSAAVAVSRYRAVTTTHITRGGTTNSRAVITRTLFFLWAFPVLIALSATPFLGFNPLIWDCYFQDMDFSFWFMTAALTVPALISTVVMMTIYILIIKKVQNTRLKVTAQNPKKTGTSNSNAEPEGSQQQPSKSRTGSTSTALNLESFSDATPSPTVAVFTTAAHTESKSRTGSTSTALNLESFSDATPSPTVVVFTTAAHTDIEVFSKALPGTVLPSMPTTLPAMAFVDRQSEVVLKITSSPVAGSLSNMTAQETSTKMTDDVFKTTDEELPQATFPKPSLQMENLCSDFTAQNTIQPTSPETENKPKKIQVSEATPNSSVLQPPQPHAVLQPLQYNLLQPPKAGGRLTKVKVPSQMPSQLFPSEVSAEISTTEMSSVMSASSNSATVTGSVSVVTTNSNGKKRHHQHHTAEGKDKRRLKKEVNLTLHLFFACVLFCLLYLPFCLAHLLHSITALSHQVWLTLYTLSLTFSSNVWISYALVNHDFRRGVKAVVRCRRAY